MSEPPVEVSTVEQAVDLLGQWVQAYRRLEVELDNYKYRADFLADLVERLDPFLPEFMQDTKLRAQKPTLYARIAEHLEEEKAACPF